MSFRKLSTGWIICIAAVLISLLANLSLITKAYSLSQEEGLSLLKMEEFQFILRVSRKNILSDFLMILLIDFFNYSWKVRLIPTYFSKAARKLFGLLANLILLIALIGLDFYLERALTPTDLPFSLNHFFLNHISVLILAYLLPYFLVRMQKIEAAERKMIKLEKEKSKAELLALKEQISPHFFFNILSTLSSIVRNEPKEKGLAFIQDLSDIYRYNLSSSKEDLVPLNEEVDFIKSYIYLLEQRFGEKLQIELDIGEAYLSNKIPPMSLQLLIENAIQHNVISKHSPLVIGVYIEDYMICVANKLQAKSSSDSFGMGLNNLKNRYFLLSSKDIQIEKYDSSFIVKLPLL